jgi:GAF domain-containing protein
MKGLKIYYILMFAVVITLFILLYFLGFMNLFLKESAFFVRYKWLDFGSEIIAVFYLIFVTIFFIVVVAIMTRVIGSLKHDRINLTRADIDEFSIKSESDDTLNIKLDPARSKNATYSLQNQSTVSNINTVTMLEEELDKVYQSFSQMINDIVQSYTISEMFEKALFWGSQLSNSRRGSLMIVDKTRELYIYKTIGWSQQEKMKIKEIRIPEGEGISGKVARENKRIFVTNLENYEGHDFRYKDEYETKSFISLPIFGLNRVVAVLNLTDNKKGYYSISELEVLNIITKVSSRIFELLQLKKKDKSRYQGD